MASLALGRMKKEFKELTNSGDSEEYKISLVNDNLLKMSAMIKGPSDTPFEGGTFQLSIVIPEQYPFTPPKVSFSTKVWHPNISSATGVICLDILKDQWAAAMSLRTVLLSIQSLLASPEPDDPQDAVVASQYKTNRQMYNITAQHWTNVYANGPYVNPTCNGKVQKLICMGFDEDQARTALSTKSWDVDRAAEYVLK